MGSLCGSSLMLNATQQLVDTTFTVKDALTINGHWNINFITSHLPPAKANQFHPCALVVGMVTKHSYMFCEIVFTQPRDCIFKNLANQVYGTRKED
ncbi:hypothetical protein L195_g009774 [Trifolium pratense]|uniref:Uncharacterized protein n=1 Tax=Trifolium pratense TaxID=57577 RepID=A0A2K3PCV4_TRIPR|nr:hypothetical protein L195_g009774 [Trifolium pratense]